MTKFINIIKKCRDCNVEISYGNTKSSVHHFDSRCGKCYLKYRREYRKRKGLL